MEHGLGRTFGGNFHGAKIRGIGVRSALPPRPGRLDRPGMIFGTDRTQIKSYFPDCGFLYRTDDPIPSTFPGQFVRVYEL